VIDPSEQEAMQEAVMELMPDKCIILNPITAVDTQGATSQTWGTVTANSRCRLDYKSGGTGGAGASLQLYNGYALTLPHDVTIGEGYRVSYGGDLYNVTEIDQDKSWKVQIVCKVEKL